MCARETLIYSSHRRRPGSGSGFNQRFPREATPHASTWRGRPADSTRGVLAGGTSLDSGLRRFDALGTRQPLPGRIRGFTLIEMVVAMVIIAVGLAGVLLTFNTVVRSSADPMLQKQMVAVAEELMEEILLKPHALAGTPPSNGPAACGAAQSVRTGFDDVRDYDQYQTTGICDVDGDAVAGLEGYGVSVRVSAVSWQGVAGTLRIEVTVSRGGESFRLTGWRTPYAT